MHITHIITSSGEIVYTFIPQAYYEIFDLEDYMGSGTVARA